MTNEQELELLHKLVDLLEEKLAITAQQMEIYKKGHERYTKLKLLANSEGIDELVDELK